MDKVIQALLRSFASLAKPGLWRYLLAPAFFSLLLWLGLAWFGLAKLVAWLIDNPPMTLLVSWGLVWLAHFLAYLGGWLAIFALAYLTTALLAAVFVLPWLLQKVAAQEYPELAALGKDSFVAALWNSLAATALFVFGWLASLPFWLIPGLGLILPMLLLAWFNRQTFAFDCLAVHATSEEWSVIRRQHAVPLFMLGLVLALLAHVPVLGLLVPALSALAYIHYCLEALRQLRGGALVSVSAVAIEGESP
ncbi:MAG: EI24 domain-containing protein [Azovibrio sp.]|uniref:EI24 domain-containing protein n=1 Tax=Azovibrio sp. TaxID=1872673 RepID=UPI003C72D339